VYHLFLPPDQWIIATDELIIFDNLFVILFTGLVRKVQEKNFRSVLQCAWTATQKKKLLVPKLTVDITE
jgi:hypothetical protein